MALADEIRTLLSARDTEDTADILRYVRENPLSPSEQFAMIQALIGRAGRAEAAILRIAEELDRRPV